MTIQSYTVTHVVRIQSGPPIVPGLFISQLACSWQSTPDAPTKLASTVDTDCTSPECYEICAALDGVFDQYNVPVESIYQAIGSEYALLSTRTVRGIVTDVAARLTTARHAVTEVTTHCPTTKLQLGTDTPNADWFAGVPCNGVLQDTQALTASPTQWYHEMNMFAKGQSDAAVTFAPVYGSVYAESIAPAGQAMQQTSAYTGPDYYMNTVRAAASVLSPIGRPRILSLVGVGNATSFYAPPNGVPSVCPSNYACCSNGDCATYQPDKPRCVYPGPYSVCIAADSPFYPAGTSSGVPCYDEEDCIPSGYNACWQPGTPFAQCVDHNTYINNGITNCFTDEDCLAQGDNFQNGLLFCEYAGTPIATCSGNTRTLVAGYCDNNYGGTSVPCPSSAAPYCINPGVPSQAFCSDQCAPTGYDSNCCEDGDGAVCYIPGTRLSFYRLENNPPGVCTTGAGFFGYGDGSSDCEVITVENPLWPRPTSTTSEWWVMVAAENALALPSIYSLFTRGVCTPGNCVYTPGNNATCGHCLLCCYDSPPSEWGCFTYIGNYSWEMCITANTTTTCWIPPCTDTVTEASMIALMSGDYNGSDCVSTHGRGWSCATCQITGGPSTPTCFERINGCQLCLTDTTEQMCCQYAATRTHAAIMALGYAFDFTFRLSADSLAVITSQLGLPLSANVTDIADALATQFTVDTPICVGPTAYQYTARDIWVTAGAPCPTPAHCWRSLVAMAQGSLQPTATDADGCLQDRICNYNGSVSPLACSDTAYFCALCPLGASSGYCADLTVTAVCIYTAYVNRTTCEAVNYTWNALLDYCYDASTNTSDACLAGCPNNTVAYDGDAAPDADELACIMGTQSDRFFRLGALTTNATCAEGYCMHDRRLNRTACEAASFCSCACPRCAAPLMPAVGLCYVEDLTAGQCAEFGGTPGRYAPALCTFPGVASEGDCAPFEWKTCVDDGDINSLDTCGWSSDNPAWQQELQCYIDPEAPCADEAACAAVGRCDDSGLVDYYRSVGHGTHLQGGCVRNPEYDEHAACHCADDEDWVGQALCAARGLWHPNQCALLSNMTSRNYTWMQRAFSEAACAAHGTGCDAPLLPCLSHVSPADCVLIHGTVIPLFHWRGNCSWIAGGTWIAGPADTSSSDIMWIRGGPQSANVLLPAGGLDTARVVGVMQKVVAKFMHQSAATQVMARVGRTLAHTAVMKAVMDPTLAADEVIRIIVSCLRTASGRIWAVTDMPGGGSFGPVTIIIDPTLTRIWEPLGDVQGHRTMDVMSAHPAVMTLAQSLQAQSVCSTGLVGTYYRQCSDCITWCCALSTSDQNDHICGCRPSSDNTRCISCAGVNCSVSNNAPLSTPGVSLYSAGEYARPTTHSVSAPPAMRQMDLQTVVTRHGPSARLPVRTARSLRRLLQIYDDPTLVNEPPRGFLTYYTQPVADVAEVPNGYLLYNRHVVMNPVTMLAVAQMATQLVGVQLPVDVELHNVQVTVTEEAGFLRDETSFPYLNLIAFDLVTLLPTLVAGANVTAVADGVYQFAANFTSNDTMYAVAYTVDPARWDGACDVDEITNDCSVCGGDLDMSCGWIYVSTGGAASRAVPSLVLLLVLLTAAAALSALAAIGRDSGT